MKKFIIKSFWFLAPFPLIWAFFAGVSVPFFDKLYNQKSAENTIFVWGDSQLYRGLDLDLLASETDMLVASAAEHGSGTYDFLMFAEKVPEQAKVIISISKTAQLRRVSKDRNMAGISLDAMQALKNQGYNVKDLARIVAKNPRPKELFSDENKLYPRGEESFTDADSVLFESIYQSIPGYASMKQAIYRQALNTLLSKNCTILFLDFPYHTMLKKIESRSEAKEVTDEFTRKILEDLAISVPDTFRIADIDSFMHDYTHLDEVGARMVTEAVASKMMVLDENSYLVIN